MRTFFLGTICLVAMVACKNEPQKPTTPVSSEAAIPKSTPPIAFADQKYIDMGKKGWEQFASGDIDGWASGFADNAIFRWSSGDSLAGKAAIIKYWKACV